MKKYANFIASFKLAVKREGKILILTESNTGFVDLPGGRVEEHEQGMPIKNLFEREIKEELGDNFRYKVLGPVFQYYRQDKLKNYVLYTVYEAEYVSGDITLSDEHKQYEWVEPATFGFEVKIFNNKGEQSAFREYFKKL